MQDNFNFKSWIMENQTGPYSKDTADYGKKQINESIEEDMKLTPPSPENIYEPDYKMDQHDRFMGLGGDKLVNMLHSKNNDILGVLSDPEAQEAVNFLIQDGFEISDIIDALNSLKDQ